MTTIYCFSGSGHSLAVSRILSQILECEIIMINNVNHTSNSDTAVIVFPVYCQNIVEQILFSVVFTMVIAKQVLQLCLLF